MPHLLSDIYLTSENICSEHLNILACGEQQFDSEALTNFSIVTEHELNLKTC